MLKSYTVQINSCCSGDMDSHRLTFLFFILFNILQDVTSTGVMEIRFHRFQFRYFDNVAESNTSVTSFTNETNESPWFSRVPCPGPPSYRFILCLDSLEHSDKSNECSLGRVDTGLVVVDEGSAMSTGMDTIFFGSAFQTPPNVVPNPMPFNFPEWPGGIRIKAYVSCCPSIPNLQDECQEEVLINYTAEPGKDRWSTLPEDVTLHQRNRLWLQVNLFCDTGYYDQNCSTHCTIDDPSQHFMCNHITGEKECTHGWQGPDCNDDIDECKKGICQNEADCKNSNGSYECICQPGFTGLFCQYRVPGCPSNPCQYNGSCVDTESGYVCYCAEPYHGLNCELLITTIELPETTTQTDDVSEYVVHGHDTEIDKPTDIGANTEHPENGNWYIIVIVIVLTLIIAAILIGVVIWNNKRKKYNVNKIEEATIPEEPSPEIPPRAPAYQNNVYMSTQKVGFARQVPFGNGIFSNIGFDVPESGENNPYKSNKAKTSSSGEEGATGGSDGSLKKHDKKTDRKTEKRENVYVPWVPDLVRSSKNNSENLMTEIDLNSQCDENELQEKSNGDLSVATEPFTHYAVSRPISEIRKEMGTTNPTGSLYSVNRFRKKSRGGSPVTSPGRRRSSVSSLVGGMVKWSPRFRKVSPDSEVSVPDLESFNNETCDNKILNDINQCEPDITKDCLSTDNQPYTNMNRRRSSYNLLELSPNHPRFQRSSDIISLSSNSSEGNIPITVSEHPQSDGSEELDTSNQYVHMSPIVKNSSQLTLDESRRQSASTIGLSVNTSPVVSDYGVSEDDIDNLQTDSDELPTRENNSSDDDMGGIVMKISS